MKKQILLFLIFIGTHPVFAQTHAFQEIFVKCPELLELRVEMQGDSVSFVRLKFSADTLPSPVKKFRWEDYSFKFEGDRYLFIQKYGKKIMELSPKDVDPAKVINKPKRRWWLLCALIYRDSIVYEYNPSVNWGIFPAYKGNGDFPRQGDALQHHAADIALEKDSILIFQAIVELDGSIRTMALILGKGGRCVYR